VTALVCSKMVYIHPKGTISSLREQT